MNSQRPYLLRAIYDWIVDNDCTPYVVVDAERDDVDVPLEHVRDGQIVLNLSMTAVDHLELGNDRVDCRCRFGGVARTVSFPVAAALALYARENGRGIVFPEESEPPEGPDGTDGPDDDGPESGGRRGGPSLKLVK